MTYFRSLEFPGKEKGGGRGERRGGGEKSGAGWGKK